MEGRSGGEVVGRGVVGGGGDAVLKGVGEEGGGDLVGMLFSEQDKNTHTHTHTLTGGECVA